MSEAAEELGTYTTDADGKVELRFERLYPRPIETVWAAMTTPERLADWLGPCEVEPHVGGVFNVFVNRDTEAQVSGKVLAWEPPNLLSFSWTSPGEPVTTVRCELTEVGPDQTRLVFTHGGMARKWLGLTFPGWHSLLERLAGLMRTGAPVPDRGMPRWRELQALYLDRYQFKDVLIDPPLPEEKYR